MPARLIRRELTARPGRWALIAAAVLVAVAFTGAAFAFARGVRGLVVPDSDTATASLPQGTVVITPRLDGLTTATALDESLLVRVRSLPGVAAANGSYDQPVSFRLGRGEGADRPSVLRGVVFSSTTSDRWDLRQGRYPRGPREVALDAGGLAVAGTFLGDTVALQVPVGTIDVAVVGIVTPLVTTQRDTADVAEGDGSVASSALAQAHAVLDPRAAPFLLDAVGRVDRITVVPNPGVEPEALARALGDALSSQLQIVAITSPQTVQQRAVTGIDQGIGAAVSGYALLTMLIGALVVANADSVLVAQRTRELALLRAVGASRGQIMRMVLGEALVVGALATIAGAWLGMWLGRVALHVVRSDAVTGLRPTGEVIVAAAVVGLGVAVLGAGVPAVRAGRVSPLDALSDSRSGADRPTRLVPAAAAAALGAAAAAVALLGPLSGPTRVTAGVAGVLVALVGIAGLSRAVVAPLAAAAGAALAPIAGVTARLGIGNARRQPSRTAGAASTLMVGLALAGAVATVGASASRAIEDQVGADRSVDLYAQRRGVVRVSSRVIDEVLSTPRLGVERFAQLVAVDGVIVAASGRTLPATATDLSGLDGLVDLDLGAGTMPISPGTDSIVVSARTAEAEGLALGDRVTLRSTSGRERRLTVVALHRNTSFVGPVVVDRATATSLGADGTFEQAALQLVEGRSPERIQRRISAMLSELPKVGLTTPREWARLRLTVVGTSLRIIGVLLSGAVAMGLAGLGVTQGLSVVERRRELGLLWSVGASLRQLRTMITLEAIFVAALAAGIGLNTGVAVGWVAMAAVPEALSGRRALPWATVSVVGALSLIAAWLVSRVVARRTLGSTGRPGAGAAGGP